MHIALWDDLDIVHASDEDSMLHYYVDGETITPSDWDLEQMKSAAKRIGRIEMKIEGVKNTALYLTLLEAMQLWNGWIGRTFFISVD